MVDMYRKKLGFTLLELLVTLVVLSVVVAVAIPSFQSTIEKNSISASISEFAATLRLARTEAVKRGRLVVVCPSADQASCSGTWQNGWLVFEDTNANGSYSAVADDLIRVHEALVADNILQWSDAGSATWADDVTTFIQYNGRGLITTSNGTFKVCSRSRNNKWARALVVGLVGSLRYGIDNTNDGIYEDESGANLSCPANGATP
ncbi:MAG: type IV fimbrial biogenesis protein FimT [Oleiphilaceae bacterium]|jgi:type IV fimbrial biogenesis protein FimT